MSNNTNVCVNERCPLDFPKTYGISVVKPNPINGVNMLTQWMLNKKNTKYVITWDFTLAEDIVVPQGCIIEFDGGSITNINDNGYSLTGRNTILSYIQRLDAVIKGVELKGTFVYKDGGLAADEEDITGEKGALQFANKEFNPDVFSGYGRVYLRKNIIVAEITDGWFYMPADDGNVYLLYRKNGLLYSIYDGTTGLVLVDNVVVETTNYDADKLPETAKDNKLGYIKCNTKIVVTLPNRCTITDHVINNSVIKKYDKNIASDGKNVLTQDMFPNDNTIYILQYDYDLDGQEVTVPENCVVIFQGGSVSNGSFIGQDTLYYNICDDKGIFGDNEECKAGTWRLASGSGGGGGIPDKEYDPEHFSGLGRKTLQLKGDSNTLTQDDFNQDHTIYVISYDFDLDGQEITIPEGCVLEFDGGSLSNGTLKGTPRIVSNQKHCLINISFPDGVNNDVIYAEWWVHDEAQDATTTLQQIIGCASTTKGIKIIFGKEQWLYSETLNIISHSKNSYTGYEFIIEGVQNETPTLVYTGNGSAITIEDENDSSDAKRGSFVQFRSIKISAPETTIDIIHLNRSSEIKIDRCSFHCPHGTCVYASNMWTYHFQDSFFEGKKGIDINGGTSAYLSNLFFQCRVAKGDEGTATAIHLAGTYVHISNIFGDYNTGTFLDCRYCRGFISSIGCESKDLDSIITARVSLLDIGEMDVFKPLADTATVFDGSMSYIHVNTMHITDTRANNVGDNPRGYLLKGITRQRVIIEKLQTNANSRFKYKPITSDGADCAVLVKSYGDGEDFDEGTISSKETEWFLPIYAGANGKNAFTDSFYSDSQFRNARMIFGLKDNKTAVKIIDGEETDLDIRYYNYGNKDDIFINSWVSKGFPYFAWAVKSVGNDNLINNSDNRYVPFLTSVPNIQSAPGPAVVRNGFSIFDESVKKPRWWGGNYWVDYDGISAGISRSGNYRPSGDQLSLLTIGFQFFDTTLGKPIWWSGDTTKGDNGWVDANGLHPNPQTT